MEHVRCTLHTSDYSLIIRCCSVLQCVAVGCSVLQCVAVCCGVLQCVAVCYSVLQSDVCRVSHDSCTQMHESCLMYVDLGRLPIGVIP